MKSLKCTSLTDEQKHSLFNLWNNEYPEKLAFQTLGNLDNYLEKLIDPVHYLALDEFSDLTAWAVTFMRENEKWFAIILEEKFHGKGIGTKILEELKESETVLNGWVIDHERDKKLNGKFYRSPIEFYLKNDFKLIPETRLELETISAVKIRWER